MSVIFFNRATKDISHGFFAQLRFHLGEIDATLTRLNVKRSCSQRCWPCSRCRDGKKQKEIGGEISGHLERCNYFCHLAPFVVNCDSIIKEELCIGFTSESLKTPEELELSQQVVCNYSFSVKFQILTILRFHLKDKGHIVGTAHAHLNVWHLRTICVQLPTNSHMLPSRGLKSFQPDKEQPLSPITQQQQQQQMRQSSVSFYCPSARLDEQQLRGTRRCSNSF